MAKIKEVVKGTGKIREGISEVECVYNVGFLNGEKCVSLSTYGSAKRKNGGVASQVLHIDKEVAQKLVDLFNKEFEL